MSFWILAQVLFNLLVLAAGAVLWVRLHRPAKDDPRLSKGLQLLQSKISILEDLSDRTETQVSQLTAILENKCRELQGQINEADQQIGRIEHNTRKSLEVAKIFQDRIPHDEIIERQKTIKYVKAARLAHQGLPVDQIAQQVDLTPAEIEMIAKVNRDQLQFSEEDLPEWAREEGSQDSAPTPAKVSFHLPRQDFVRPEPPVSPAPAPSAPEVTASEQTFVEIDLQRPEPAAPPAAASPVTREKDRLVKAQTTSGKSVEVRPVVFPRVDQERP